MGAAAAGPRRVTNSGGTEPGRLLKIAFGNFNKWGIKRLQDDYARPPQE